MSVPSFALIKSKFPEFARPFYEAFIHKKVDSQYDLAVAIPSGAKRAFLWFTTFGTVHIACILEVAKNQSIQDSVHVLHQSNKYPKSYYAGTLLSGYLIEGLKYFIADDLFCFKGYEFGNPLPIPHIQKQKAFLDFFEGIGVPDVDPEYRIYCIVMWKRSHDVERSEEDGVKDTIGYDVKHVQYRSSNYVLPFANVPAPKNPWTMVGGSTIEDQIDYVPKTNWSDLTNKYKKQLPNLNINFSAPIHRKNTLFWVSADIMYDMYYLYTKNDIVFQHAGIPNFQTSVMMNKLFRVICENDVLDKVEESEDEEDFEDIREDKHVDLNKKVLMECRFYPQFKKWVPIRTITRDFERHVPPIEEFLYTKNKINNGVSPHHHNASNASNNQYHKYNNKIPRFERIHHSTRPY